MNWLIVPQGIFVDTEIQEVTLLSSFDAWTIKCAYIHVMAILDSSQPRDAYMGIVVCICGHELGQHCFGHLFVAYMSKPIMILHQFGHRSYKTFETFLKGRFQVSIDLYIWFLINLDTDQRKTYETFSKRTILNTYTDSIKGRWNIYIFKIKKRSVH